LLDSLATAGTIDLVAATAGEFPDAVSAARRFAHNVQAASKRLHVWLNLGAPPFYFVTNSIKQRYAQVPSAGTGKLLNEFTKDG